MEPVKVLPRRICGSWRRFVKRYQPVLSADNNHFWEHDRLPKGVDERLVWTALDIDGRIIVVPGYHRVNYHARVLCTRPWSDVESQNPGYVW